MDVVHKTVNVYATDRCAFFISDAPHLLKTLLSVFFSWMTVTSRGTISVNYGKPMFLATCTRAS